MKIERVGFFTNSKVITAVEHLRVLAPLDFFGITVVPCYIEGKPDFKVASDCQLFVVQRDFAGDFSAYQAVISFANKADIPVILELDDNLLELSFNHVDKLSLYYANRLFPLIQSLTEADAVTVSTPELRDAVKRYNPKVFVLPNYLDTTIWEIKAPKTPDKADRIRILYMGTTSHRPDLEMITPALESVADTHPNLCFVFLGIEPPDSLIQRNQAEYVASKTFEYSKFAKLLSELDADIAIAPLKENSFNVCKSPLKYFEYSAIGLPGVYSKIAPYSSVIEDNITGCLASEDSQDWVNKINFLIENPEIRYRIATQAQEFVKENHTLAHHASAWQRVYEQVTKRSKVTPDVIEIPSKIFTDITSQLDALGKRNAQETKFLLQEINKHKEQEDKYESDIQEVKSVASKLLEERNKTQDELSSIYNSRSWKIIKILRETKSRITLNQRSSSKVNNIDEDLNLIRNSGYFNRDWYLEHNPDVKNSRLDPIKHYYLFGGFEGRDPSSQFDSSTYLETHPEIKNAGINPLVHHLKFGKIEVKSIPTHPDPIQPPPSTKTAVAKGESGYYYKKAVQIVKEEGLGSLVTKARKKIGRSREFEHEVALAESEVDYVVSIIIPAFNAIQYTKECIEKVYSVSSKYAFEVIVVDNASSDETQAEMRKERFVRKDFSYYRMEENLGFAGGVNFGMQQAKGQYVVILNNDTLPTSGWLDLLVEALKNDQTIGIVSPVTNYVGEGPQLELAAKDIKPLDIDTYAASIKGHGIYYEPGRLVFFCVMIRRSVIDQIGLLDEGYIKGNFEDDDYCLRTILSGYKLAIAKSSFVFHHGSITFIKNKIVHSDHMELNRKRFFLKTGNLAVSLRAPFERTKNPSISVVVRTLNRRNLLQKALASLANQNYRDFEVVLVNDGGESVQDVVDKFSGYFPINYIQHEQSKGRTPALNAGVANAKTEWVTFLDDDDIVYPWHLSTMYNSTQLNPDGRMYYSNYNRTLFQTAYNDSPVLLRGVEPWPYDKDELWVTNRIPMHSWLIASECFKQVGLFDENQVMLEDFEFLVRLSNDYDFFHVDRVTCEYRFYLDGMNSMINNRGKTLEALEYIYSNHSSYNQDIFKNRKFELEALKDQIEKINSIRQKLTDNGENDEQAMRQITKLILGF